MSNDHEARPGRQFATFLCCLLGIVTAVHILPGIEAEETLAAVAVGVLLGVAYLILRPAMRLLTLPLGCLTLGLTNFFIDIGLIYACEYLIEGFHVSEFIYAALAAVLVNALCVITGGFR